MHLSKPTEGSFPPSITQNLITKKRQHPVLTKGKLAPLLLTLFSGLMLPTAVIAAKGSGHDDFIRQVCPLPKELINVETPQGEIKTLCVNAQMADWLLPHASVSYAPPPAVLATQGSGHDDPIRKVCPLPKKLINIETPQGKIKTLCVKAKAADKLLSRASVTQPPLPSPVGAMTLTSLATELMLASVKGVVGGISGTAAGWALSALGFADSAAQTNEILGKMSGQLEAIAQTLTQMSAEVANIDEAIRIQTCSNFISDTLGARSLIDSLSSDYQDFAITAGSAGFIPPLTNCPISGTGICVEDWADAVLDNSSQTRGIANAVLQIHNSMITLSSNDGIIASCLDTKVLPLPVPNEGDSNYYASVSSLMNAFYNYQARALLLLIEAHHFNAWKVSGPDGELGPGPGGDPVSDPSITSDLCAAPSNPTAALSCQKTVSSLDTVHKNLVQQFTMAGVGYSDEAARINYQNNSTPLLFVRSLEDFTTEAHQQGKSELCSYPLSSSAPCGITVGNQLDASVPFGITYDYQDAWRPALARDFGLLMANIGQESPASFLEDAGFDHPQDKLIIHANTFTNTMSTPNIREYETLTSTVTCFTDLDIPMSYALQPVCEQSRTQPFWEPVRIDHILIGYHFHPKPTIPTLGTRNMFYDFTTKRKDLHTQQFVYTPGWDTNARVHRKAYQYLWPVLPVDEISCTKERSATNVAGAYTRCGDDLDVWLTQNVPGPTVNDGLQPTYQEIGEQPWDIQPSYLDETGAQLTDGLLPPVNADTNDDRWVAFQFQEVDIPQPSVEFHLGKETDISIISVTYFDLAIPAEADVFAISLGPDRVEIFVSNDGGDTYPADPVTVYSNFIRGSQDPNVSTHTAFIPVNIKDTDTIRMDFYQGEDSPDTMTRSVFLGEVSFLE